MYFYFLLAVYAIRGYRGRINKSIKKTTTFLVFPKNLGYEPEIHISLFGCSVPAAAPRI
jgi:hypothetical protein